MQIKTLRKSNQPEWVTLFAPEDTSTEDVPHSINCRYGGVMGTIKCWLWIVISIAAALAMGRLLGG